ncbi:MAG: hypothetical protein NC390_06980 [Fusobacterium sp.]|nr:hypothetical protein [Fusobacterium sp.]
MCLFMILTRKLFLTRQKYDVNAKIMNITRKITDLQRYATNIADGKISGKEMYDVPTKFFGRQSIFQQYAHNRSLQMANMQMATMAPMMAMQMQGVNPQYAQMYQQNMFMNLYKEARQEAAEEEKKLLNEQEKELVLEKEKLQALAQEYDVELKGLNEALPRSFEIVKPNIA